MDYKLINLQKSCLRNSEVVKNVSSLQKWNAVILQTHTNFLQVKRLQQPIRQLVNTPNARGQ